MLVGVKCLKYETFAYRNKLIGSSIIYKVNRNCLFFCDMPFVMCVVFCVCLIVILVGSAEISSPFNRGTKNRT